MCLWVCVSVRLWLWTKFKTNGWTDLEAVFFKWLLIALAQILLKLVTLGQRSRSQWRNTHFFFMILYWLPYLVSQFFYAWSKWNSVCHLDIPLVDLCLNFMKFEWRHLNFLQTIVNISNSIEPTNFVLGTNTQQYNVYLIIKMKLTLTDDEGHRRRSKVTKIELMVIYRKPGTKV